MYSGAYYQAGNKDGEKAKGMEDCVDMSILKLMGQIISNISYLFGISYSHTLTSKSMNKHTVPSTCLVYEHGK